MTSFARRPIAGSDSHTPEPYRASGKNHATEFQCPLLGVKRTFIQLTLMSAFDPKRTWRFDRPVASRQVPSLPRSASPYRIYTSTAGDAPRCIRNQLRAHSSSKVLELDRSHSR